MFGDVWELRLVTWTVDLTQKRRDWEVTRAEN